MTYGRIQRRSTAGVAIATVNLGETQVHVETPEDKANKSFFLTVTHE